MLFKMAQAVTHVLIPIILVSLYRTYLAKPKFSRWYVLFAGVAGLLPDLDYPLSYIFPEYFFHGMFHLMYVALLFWFAALIFRKFNYPRKYYLTAIILAFGFTMHLSFDCIAGGYEFFYPFSVLNYCPNIIPSNIWPGLDAVLLVLWLAHEYFEHKIKAFF